MNNKRDMVMRARCVLARLKKGLACCVVTHYVPRFEGKRQRGFGGDKGEHLGVRAKNEWHFVMTKGSTRM